MPDENRIARAARQMFESHRAMERLTRLPPDIQPRDLDEAYLMQDRLLEHYAEAGLGAVAGWKIAQTSIIMQQLAGIDHPSEGAIRAPLVRESPAEVPATDFVDLLVESEIAVSLAHDLPATGAPHSRNSVADAIATCMAGIEVADARGVDYDELDVPLLIADNSMNRGCVLGPAVEDWRGIDLAATAGRMFINGELVGEGHGRDALGHPFEVVAWLANNLNKRGRMLRAGDVVLTGSIVPSHQLAAGDEMLTVFDHLGEARIRVV